MGRDKASLLLAGSTLLQRAVQALSEAGATRVVVSGAHAGYDCVADVVPGSGPLGGIASALAVLPDGHVLFVPVDMPLLDATLLRLLFAAAGNQRSTRFGNEPLPWLVHVDRPLRALVDNVLVQSSQQRSIRKLQLCVGTDEVSITPALAAQLRNANTPEDWAQFERAEKRP